MSAFVNLQFFKRSLEKQRHICYVDRYFSLKLEAEPETLEVLILIEVAASCPAEQRRLRDVSSRVSTQM